MRSIDPGAYHLGELALGAASAAVGCVAARVIHPLRPIGTWAPFALAAVVLTARGALPFALAAAVVSCLPLTRVRRRSALSRIAAVLVCVLIVVGVPEGLPRWALVAAPVAVIVSALGLRSIEGGPRWVVPVITLVCGVGVWLSVPDTEVAIYTVGVLAITTLWSIWTKPSRATSIAWPTATLIISTAVLGAQGRPSTLPGALTCMGLGLGCGVLIALAATGIRLGHASVGGIRVVLAHVLVVGGASRWASRTSLVAAGATRSAIIIVIAAALAWVLTPPGRIRSPI